MVEYGSFGSAGDGDVGNFRVDTVAESGFSRHSLARHVARERL